MKGTERGITLIALIITIVVMLILVGVSLQMALQSGLFNTAGNAVGKFDKEMQNEAQIADGKVTINNITYNSAVEYVEGFGLNGGNQTEMHSWTRSGDDVTCNHCNKTYTIGDVVNYTAGGQASTSISEAKSGYAEQTLNKDTNVVWVVLGIEDSNKDGNSETLLLTTQEPTAGFITLYGAAAYNNVITELKRMCSELYGENARAMTIEDVNNCLGYTPTGGTYYKNGYRTTTGNFTTELIELETWESITNRNATYYGGKYYTPEHPEGTTDATQLGKYQLDGYRYYLSNDKTYIVDPVEENNKSHTVTEATRKLIFGSTKNYTYWLASRGVYAASDCIYFGPGSVVSGIVYTYDTEIFDSFGDSHSEGMMMRPVVSIKSEIPAGM